MATRLQRSHSGDHCSTIPRIARRPRSGPRRGAGTRSTARSARPGTCGPRPTAMEGAAGLLLRPPAPGRTRGVTSSRAGRPLHRSRRRDRDRAAGALRFGRGAPGGPRDRWPSRRGGVARAGLPGRAGARRALGRSGGRGLPRAASRPARRLPACRSRDRGRGAVPRTPRRGRRPATPPNGFLPGSAHCIAVRRGVSRRQSRITGRRADGG